MIVEVKILYDDLQPHGGRGRDKVIRAIDGAMNGADWQKVGDGWMAIR